MDNNNILISGIVPCRDKLNAKATQVKSFLENECCKRNICFTNNSNTNPTYHCNQSGIHLNKSETNRLIENLFALSKFDSCQKAQVSMTTNVYRQTSNSEEQLLSEKKCKRNFPKFKRFEKETSLKCFPGAF